MQLFLIDLLGRALIWLFLAGFGFDEDAARRALERAGYLDQD